MLYFIFRPLARIALLIFFRKIYISGEEYLPDKDTALILACNHPNGFLEPIILACFLKFPLHFLVRGDLFKNKMLKPILTGTNQIPIFRFKDGFSAMKNNIDTMDDSLRIIGEKKALLIYPEGSTHQTIYLRPLKKGTARLALQAKKMHQDLPLKLIPIAVNYTDPNAFRSDVMIEIGKPVNIQLKDEKEIPANQQIMQLTSQLETQMKALVKQVDPIEEEDLVIELLQLKAGFDPYKPFPVFERSNVHLQTDRELVYQFNAMEDKASLKEKWQLLRSLLHTKGLHDLVRYKSASHFILKAILLIVLFPFFLVATIVHFIPIFTMKRIIRKYVKSREFETSVLTAGSAGLVVLLYFSFTILALIFKPIWILLIPIFLISLFAAAFFYDILLDLRLQLKLFISGKRYRKQLFDEARAILHSLNFNN